MKLTAHLAKSQLKINRKRAVWTLVGIALATAMITAVFGFAASGMAAMYELVGELRDVYNHTIMGMGAVVSAIIVTASVIVISNSFRVSAGERLSQFGILKSTGATKRQIAETIMYESVFLSVVGIPIGVVVGLTVQLFGVYIANLLIHNIGMRDGMQLVTDGELMFNFIIAWQAILVSAAIGFFTVLLSAWLPARKAAKIPAINAIRRVGDVKIEAKKIRSSKIVQALFGFEGTLASKSLKRSKRNFRATVVSLTISIVMFIAASSFGVHLNRMVNLVVHPVEADIIVGYYSMLEFLRTDDYDFLQSPAQVFWPINHEIAEHVTARMRDFPNATVMGVGTSISSWRWHGISIEGEMLTRDVRNFMSPYSEDDSLWLGFTFMTVDEETYAELCRIAGVPLGSNILVNYSRIHSDGRWAEFSPIAFDYQTLTVNIDDEEVHVPLHGQLRYEQVPSEVIHSNRNALTVIVPYLDAKTYRWFISVDDAHGFTDFMQGIFDEYIELNNDLVYMTVYNRQANLQTDRTIIRLVMVFVYGFVGMLTLIGLTNVISTIATNVRSRSREFAVLESVGMAHKGINRMLNLESILCSIKSLIYGIPLGLFASFLIYRFILFSVHFGYSFPWAAVLQCVMAVFLLTWITMRYAAARLKGKNIVETIRGEGGV